MRAFASLLIRVLVTVLLATAMRTTVRALLDVQRSAPVATEAVAISKSFELK